MSRPADPAKEKVVSTKIAAGAKEALKAKAGAEGRTLSEYLRELILRHLGG